MLKRISVDDLALGMYVHELCGSWMDHPFWRSRFVLDNPRDLERIRATPIREVMIDLSHGKDVAARPQAAAPLAAPIAAPRPTAPPMPDHAPTRTREEMRRAALICGKAGKPWCRCSRRCVWAGRPIRRPPAGWCRKFRIPSCATPARSSASRA